MIDRNTTIKQQMIMLLGISEDCYLKLVEQFGYDYAYDYYHHSEWAVAHITRTAAYWRWWNKLQYLRDETFLSEYACYHGSNSENELMDLWLDANTPAEVKGRPTRKVIQDTQALMEESAAQERNQTLLTKK